MNQLDHNQNLRACIGLGSNLGDSRQILESSLQIIGQTPGINILKTSSWYQTKPVGGPRQPDYLNGCAMLQVKQTPEELLVLLQGVEQQFGRVREQRWAARTLDLDILLYDELVLDTPNLQIPHPRMSQRAFVLVPLAEIAPDWILPDEQVAVAQLAQQIDRSGVQLAVG